MADSGSSKGIVHLHGDLDLKIIEARMLPNMDIILKHFCRCITACGTIKFHSSAAVLKDGGDRKIHRHRKIIASDAYVKIMVLPETTVARTRVIKNSRNPVWNEHFNIPLGHPVIDLEFRVKDDDIFVLNSWERLKFRRRGLPLVSLLVGGSRLLDPPVSHPNATPPSY